LDRELIGGSNPWTAKAHGLRRFGIGVNGGRRRFLCPFHKECDMRRLGSGVRAERFGPDRPDLARLAEGQGLSGEKEAPRMISVPTIERGIQATRSRAYEIANGGAKGI
jgi:hypothetical protein